jgi:DNA/RNA endonuclease YhcR with UshA esterase domain
MLLLLTLPTFAFAEDEKPAEKAVIQASDKAAIEANKDQNVTVEGVVSESAWSGTGKVMNIRFEDARESGFVAVIFEKSRSAFDAVYDGDTAKALLGARIHVTGKIGTYRDKPQIILSKPAQLKIVEKPKSADEKPAK